MAKLKLDLSDCQKISVTISHVSLKRKKRKKKTKFITMAPLDIHIQFSKSDLNVCLFGVFLITNNFQQSLLIFSFFKYNFFS